jgi:hypothetical protein
VSPTAPTFITLHKRLNKAHRRIRELEAREADLIAHSAPSAPAPPNQLTTFVRAAGRPSRVSVSGSGWLRANIAPSRPRTSTVSRRSGSGNRAGRGRDMARGRSPAVTRYLSERCQRALLGKW